MAGRGPAPKPKEQRRRRNADPVAEVPLSSDGSLRGPTLNTATGTAAWSKQTKSWWETWRRSPQSAVFLETDWQRLAMLAPLVEQYWQNPESKILSEIRLNEERLGATVVDRQRARMKVEEPKDAPVVQLAVARDRLASRLPSE